MTALVSKLRDVIVSNRAEWKVTTLGSVGRVVSGGTPATTNAAFWGGGIPWITPAEITGLPTRYVSISGRTISRAGLQASSAELLPARSLIVCTRASVGEMVINTVPMATNQGFKSIVPHEGVSVEFIYYSLRANVRELHRLAAGSTFSEVSKTAFEGIPIAIPKGVHQQRIADILGNMDDEASLLASLTDKHRRRQQWLMSNLLVTGPQPTMGENDEPPEQDHA